MTVAEKIKELVKDGKTSSEISKELSISKSSVNAIILSILYKLGVYDPNNYALHCKLKNPK